MNNRRFHEQHCDNTGSYQFNDTLPGRPRSIGYARLPGTTAYFKHRESRR